MWVPFSTLLDLLRSVGQWHIGLLFVGICQNRHKAYLKGLEGIPELHRAVYMYTCMNIYIYKSRAHMSYSLTS